MHDGDPRAGPGPAAHLQQQILRVRLFIIFLVFFWVLAKTHKGCLV